MMHLAALIVVGLAGVQDPVPLQLPEGTLPSIGAWFWHAEEFEGDGYKKYVESFAEHTPFDLLSTSSRHPNEITDAEAHNQIKRAVIYARDRGLDIALDVDVRLARKAFQVKYPDEQQEILRLRTVPLAGSGTAELRIKSDVLTDHMTGGTTPYLPLRSRLVRVYAYAQKDGEVILATLQDITKTRCTVTASSEKEIVVSIACDGATEGGTACVMAAFTHFTPDVYAPHFFEFQRDLIAQYADMPLAGLMKDEWGFPPCHNGCPDKNDYWYSDARAAAYAERTQGRDLLRDCLLMTYGAQGKQSERQAAINTLLSMSRERNAAIEDDFYKATKETFGPNAYVCTHATWHPYPGVAEFKKHGLDWWVATRDLAQTDEFTPYCCRTSLAKKWGSGLWYNQYYSKNRADYDTELWRHAAGGGRMNYHPIYPYQGKDQYERQCKLARGGLMRGEARLRLLNLITKTPIDCPVAVVFGHACAMNWAGPAYNDVGLKITEALWKSGFYADLIPSSEIGTDAFRVDLNGQICYGPQPYAAVVLYHPEFEDPDTGAFFRAAAQGKTALFRVGDWTRDFQANAFDGNAALPEAMTACKTPEECVSAVIAALKKNGVAPCTPAPGAPRPSDAPGLTSHHRLIDGTHILTAGAENVEGDPIQTSITVNGQAVAIDAVGVAGVRLSDDGRLEALAAGGLKSFKSRAMALELPRPVDLALWRDAAGRLHGLVQDWEGPIPAPLAALTSDWQRLRVPVSPPEPK